MGKSAILSVILSALFIYCPAQEGVEFTFAYKPEKVYNSASRATIRTTLTLRGSKGLLDSAAQRGFTNPYTLSLESATETKIATGKLQDSGAFPMVITIVKNTIDGQNGSLPPGTVVYWRYSAARAPVLDSISSGQINDTIKTQAARLLQSIYNYVPFPPRKLNINDTFSQQVSTNVAMPMNAPPAHITVTITYKLTGIENGIANFDMLITDDMQMRDPRFNFSGSGGGSGKMLFDIKAGFYTQYEMQSALSYNVASNRMTITGTSETSISRKFTISDN